MARYERKGAGAGVLNRLIFLVILIPVAVAVIAFLLSPSSPFRSASATEVPHPVLIEQIHKQYKLVTASVQASKIETASTQNALPFTQEKYQYEAVFTLTAGIDMSQIKDSDIQANGTSVTIHLPTPQILSNELDLARSGVVNHDEQLLSGLSKNPNLLTLMQEQARKDIVTQVLEQGQLIADAKTNAEEDLGNLAHQMGFTNVKFVYDTPGTPTPDLTPKATLAPA